MKKKNKSDLKKSDTAAHSTGLAVLALVVLFFLLIFARLIGFVQSLGRPLSHDLQNTKGYTWDKKSTSNVVFATLVSPDETAVSVVHFDPKNESLAILDITGEVYTSVPKGFGNWRIGSVYKLGQEEKPPIGGELLKLSVSQLIGLPVEGIVLLKDKNSNPASIIAAAHSNRLSLLSLFSKMDSDLSPIELFNLFSAYADVRSDKVASLDFEKSSITDSKLLPDTTRVLGINVVQLDTFVRDNLADTSIQDEGASVAILNGTTHPGLTTSAAREVTNMGGTVTMVNTTEKPIDKSIIVVNNSIGDTPSPVTGQRLTEIFAPNCLKNACKSTDSMVSGSRARYTIVLGEDYYNLWFNK